MVKKIEITKKERSLFKKYKRGDVVSVSISDYAKMHNVFQKKIFSEKKYTKKMLEEDKSKFSRSILILWNDKHSDFLVATSLTSKNKEYKNLNFKVDDLSYANCEALLLNKRKIKILFSGKIHTFIGDDLIHEYNSFLRKFKKKTFTIQKELIEFYSQISLLKEREERGKYIKELEEKIINIK